jgi:hypothetical protein
MDPRKMAKLLDYAKLLAKQGESFEKEGSDEEAIPQYIKVVDILLLLAESAPTYPDWTNYVSKAEFYQKRTKTLLAKISMKREKQDVKPRSATATSGMAPVSASTYAIS